MEVFLHLAYIVALNSGCRISAEKSSGGLMGVPLYVVVFPSLPYYSPLAFNSCRFNCNVSRCGSLWVHIWNSLGSLDVDVCFLPHDGEVIFQVILLFLVRLRTCTGLRQVPGLSCEV